MRAPSPLQKALPGPDTLLHGGMQGKQGCKAPLAPSISGQHPARRTGKRQGLAGCSRTSLCCRWTHGTRRDKQPDPSHRLPVVRTSPTPQSSNSRGFSWGGRRPAETQINFKLCQLV